MNKNKTYTLTPDWKYYFPIYLISILTIPLIMGIAGLYFLRRYQKSIHFIISDTTITAADKKYQQKIDIINIRNIKLEQDWLQQKMCIGSLIIHTAATKMRVAGIKRPEEIKELIEQAVQALKKQTRETTHRAAREPKYDPGSMEKINYLTGLWQQGLISDEDFEEERKGLE